MTFSWGRGMLGGMTKEVEEKVLSYYRTWPIFWAGDLKPEKEYAGRTWFQCPFGDGHLAYFVRLPRNPQVLFCPCCERHAWVDVSMGGAVKSVLLKEELLIREKVKKWDGLEGCAPEEGFRLWQERGCPREMVEEVVSDLPGFLALVESHSEKSRTSKKAIYG